MTNDERAAIEERAEIARLSEWTGDRERSALDVPALLAESAEQRSEIERLRARLATCHAEHMRALGLIDGGG